MRIAAVSALVLATAVLTAGGAHAQQARTPVAAPAQASAGEAPWYERFTFGSQASTGPNARVPRAEPRTSLRVAPQSRWSVSVGEDDQVAARMAPGAASRLPNASAGVSFDVTRNARVGAAVTLPARPGAQTDEDDRRRRQAEPGVKIESFFRF